jgi:hypothetical protein
MKRQQRGYKMQGGNNEQSGAASGALDRSRDCLSMTRFIMSMLRGVRDLCGPYVRQTPLYSPEDKSQRQSWTSSFHGNDPANRLEFVSNSLIYRLSHIALRCVIRGLSASSVRIPRTRGTSSYPSRATSAWIDHDVDTRTSRNRARYGNKA